MLVFGLVAVAFAVYGLVTVEKSVTDGAFNVLTSVSDYATDAFDTLDALLDTIGSTSNMYGCIRCRLQGIGCCTDTIGWQVAWFG